MLIAEALPLVANPSVSQDPQRTRHIHNHHFDSRRWDHVALRDDHIVIASPYKSGTTWLQAIVDHLVFDVDIPAPLSVLSPRLEANYHDLDALALTLDQQRHRRFLYIARDGRDVARSLWNHYAHWSDQAHVLVNQVPNERGETFPLAPADFQTFFDGWLHNGWLAWERDGWPFWSFFHNVQSWWDHHQQPTSCSCTTATSRPICQPRSSGLPPFSAGSWMLPGSWMWRQQWPLVRRPAAGSARGLRPGQQGSPQPGLSRLAAWRWWPDGAIC